MTPLLLALIGCGGAGPAPTAAPLRPEPAAEAPPATGDADVRALEKYRAGDDPSELAKAARAVAKTRSTRAAAPLYAAFERLRLSDPRARVAYRDVHDAMVTIADPSWRPGLVAHLERPVDPLDPKNAIDEQFWQVTAAEILGRMRAVEAVRPLLEILLSPAKGFVGTTAVLALVKIGKPAMPTTLAVLRGEDQEILAYAREQARTAAIPGAPPRTKEGSEAAPIAVAALVLGTMGRSDAEAPLLAALERAPNDFVRVAIASQLPKLPKSPAILAAFRRTVERTDPGFATTPSDGARTSMLETSALFFDATLVPWYVDQAKSIRGKEEDVEALREASLSTALKLAAPDRMAKVDELARLRNPLDHRAVGEGFRPEIALAKELVSACERRVDCYVRALGEPRSQAQPTWFRGIKAAFMAGALGDASTRGAIVDQLPAVTHPVVRYVAVSALDALSPKGDVALADRLERIVVEDEATMDPARISANAPLKTVIYRLRARAEE